MGFSIKNPPDFSKLKLCYSHSQIEILNESGAFQIYAFLLPHPALSKGAGDR
jgi:hypothetical protein